MTRGYLIHALSPLHAGTGQGVGLIDLPIAREVSTQHPFVPGSTIKGVLRRAVQKDVRIPLFGPDTDKAQEHAGALRFSDARVLLFPVQADHGTFAWVTSPMVLHRTLRDWGRHAAFSAKDIPQVVSGKAVVTPNSAVVYGDHSLVLDGTAIEATQEEGRLVEALANALFPTEPYWHLALAERLVVVDDEQLVAFLKQCTDVRAHVRIGEDGTVTKGALWYEETLPPETVLCGLIQYASNGQCCTAEDGWAALGEVTANPIQVGGGATTGHGRAQLRLVGGVA